MVMSKPVLYIFAISHYDALGVLALLSPEIHTVNHQLANQTPCDADQQFLQDG